MKDISFCQPFIVCRDGDIDTNTPDPKPDAKPKVEFSPEQQAKINEILAEDRRKADGKYKGLEKQYETLLANQNLTKQERTTLEQELEDVRAQFRTKEQQAAIDKKNIEEKYKADLESTSRERDSWRTRYVDTSIRRELQDAAVGHDAFNPSQVVTLLFSKTKMVEVKDEATGKPTGDMKPMVDFDDIDLDTHEPIRTQRTPEEAVKRMKELPELYGNLFKSGVVSGIGSNSATAGHAAGKDGRVDVRKLSQEQYAKLRRENPSALGLRPRRGR